MDRVVGGQTIRKGTTVSIFILAIHNDANVFPDPDKFDPDRFADNGIVIENQSAFAYIPFSAGSRQRFAGLEERVILSSIFRRFKFRSTQTIDDLHLCADAILRPRVPIQMIIERRYPQ
ncbi:unnamed protein product [Rotaria sp. Silwood2]|nr:unnamed protein product [Rotaria sp. Silwood2]